jgi:hypothetical protein
MGDDDRDQALFDPRAEELAPSTTSGVAIGRNSSRLIADRNLKR